MEMIQFTAPIDGCTWKEALHAAASQAISWR